MDLNKLIHAALFTPMDDVEIEGAWAPRWGLPLLLNGNPGIGKTSKVRSVSRQYGLPLVDLSVTKRGDAAFGVIPIPTSSGRIRYGVPEWIRGVEGGGIVFVDEITSARPDLQAAVMGLVLDREVGDVPLGARVRVLAACNPPDVAANGHTLEVPMANRFVHVDWLPATLDELGAVRRRAVTGELVQVLDAEAEEARVLAAWPAAYGRAVALELGFHRAQPQWRNKMPSADDPNASRAWPSDRSWSYASRALAAAEVHGLDETTADALVAGSIGAAACSAWRVYLQKTDLPDVADVLDGKAIFKHSGARADRTYAFLTAATALLAPTTTPHRARRAEALLDLMLGIEGCDDLLATAMTDLAGCGLHIGTRAIKVLSKIQPVVSAAHAAGARRR